jgi:hypothetical protein
MATNNHGVSQFLKNSHMNSGFKSPLFLVSAHPFCVGFLFPLPHSSHTHSNVSQRHFPPSSFALNLKLCFGIVLHGQPPNLPFRFALFPVGSQHAANAPWPTVCPRPCCSSTLGHPSAQSIVSRTNKRSQRQHLIQRDTFLCTNSFHPQLINSNNVSLQQNRCDPWRQQPNLLRRHGWRPGCCSFFQHLGTQRQPKQRQLHL